MKSSFFEKRWGVFNHFLYGSPGGVNEYQKLCPDWNRRTEELDVEKLADQLHKMGAQYYFITLMQGRKYMLAPNDTFDRIAGTKPGEACSRRDVIADLIAALDPYGIDLCLYFTGDGPYKDEEIGQRFGFLEPRKNVSMAFVKRWAAVLEEYSLRYGDKVKAWWIDGCYDYFGYNRELLDVYHRAAQAGNKWAAVAFNNGVKPEIKAWGGSDFTAGEFNDFTYLPRAPFVDGAKAHILAPLGIMPDGKPGGAWCCPGAKRDHAYMKDYIDRVNRAGGLVTVDLYLEPDGTFDPAQMEALTGI